MYRPDESTVREPPKRLTGIIRQLGPGLIIAASIVGSGELIATTRTGAEAGFTLLWLILIGCVIKVFVQVELGRYTMVTGKTPMEGLNEVPGPRLRVNWILWYWLVMFIVSMAQLGGVVGGVGQALAIARPLTADGARLNAYQDSEVRQAVAEALGQLPAESEGGPQAGPVPFASDDVWWALIVTLVTTVLLVLGRYGVVQSVSTFLVAGFTFVSILNLIYLQNLPDWSISGSELLEGLSFQLPASAGGLATSPLATALAAFGIIGVGATELIQYPYWCLEKGYARWTGPRSESREWVERARGWLSVLRWDAWCSAAVYTFATVVFYLLGAAVLGRAGLNPEGASMVRTLAEMYVPVFGPVAQIIFLCGAVIVLYSTFFVATAGHARVCADAMRVFGLSRGGEDARRFWVKVFSAFFPPFCFFVYVFIRAPVALILASGVMQAIMLPMLALGALFFRYRRSDARLLPGRLWDGMLWLAAAVLATAGIWLAVTRLGLYLG